MAASSIAMVQAELDAERQRAAALQSWNTRVTDQLAKSEAEVKEAKVRAVDCRPLFCRCRRRRRLLAARRLSPPPPPPPTATCRRPDSRRCEGGRWKRGEPRPSSAADGTAATETRFVSRPPPQPQPL